MSSELSSYFSEPSIVHLTICPGTHEQNGVVERKNQIFSVCNAWSNGFWSKALLIVTYLMNRLVLHLS